MDIISDTTAQEQSETQGLPSYEFIANLGVSTLFHDGASIANPSLFESSLYSSSKCEYIKFKQIPETNLLMTVWSNYESSISFGVFDFVNHKPVFGIENSSGRVGDGDFSCSKKGRFVAVASIMTKASYHLFDNSTCSIAKVARWNPLHKTIVTSLSLDSECRLIATLDWHGSCVLADIYTGSTLGDFQSRSKGWLNRCRWNPLPASPILALNNDVKYLYLLDAEKGISDPQVSYQTRAKITFALEWREDGNLAALTNGPSIDVYDIRTKKLVKTFSGTHTDDFESLDWNESGRLLASTSKTSLNIWDFASEKTIFENKGKGGNKSATICFIKKN